ncbi:MAG: HlyD family efflux transporter periplasmic adaptor subunit [Lachnospiraceae bacterium]|nr:HlyD family efflux transporter periplasmic adaptor subunit [Lachnospiraceae bacterium]
MKKFLEFVKKHKKAVIILAVVAVVAVLAIKIAKTVKDAQNLLAGMQSSASTEKIEERDIVNSVSATGTIVAVENRTYSTSVTGVKVKEVNVKVGDTVNPGDILCVLDEEDFEKQLADAKTMYNADSGRAGIDVQASNRGLNEAVTTRDIAAQRAEEDKNNAYHDFSSAADECQEAEDVYNDASKAASSAKDRMKEAEEKFNSAENALKNIKSTGLTDDEKDTELQPYKDKLTEMKNYIEGLGTINPTEAGKIIAGWEGAVALTGDSSNISGVSVSMIYEGTDDAVSGELNGYLGALNSAYVNYTQKKTAAEATGEAQKAKAQKEYTDAQTAYQTAKAEYEAAKATEESKKSIYDSKVKNVESLYDAFNQTVRNADDSKRNNDSAVASRVDSVKNSKLSASTATLSDSRNIESLEEKIEGCVVSSTIGGIVTKVDVTAGDMYAGGAMVTVENTSAYEVSAQIDEYDISKIKEGQEVVIKTNGTGTLELKGTVKSIAPHATASTNLQGNSSGVKYEVRVNVLTPCEDLKLDMTAKIEIICEKSEGVLAVPTEAIQEDEEGNFFVEILDKGEPIDTSKMLTDPESISKEDTEKLQSGEKNYESHNVYITKGLVGDYYTEISGEGLEAGMRIVVPNNGAFSDISQYMDEAGAMGGF